MKAQLSRWSCTACCIWLAQCQADLPDGVFACTLDTDCPPGAHCYADAVGARLCYRRAPLSSGERADAQSAGSTSISDTAPSGAVPSPTPDSAAASGPTPAATPRSPDEPGETPAPADPIAGPAPGEACSTELAKSCANEFDKVVCTKGQWQFNGSCDGNERCDVSPGTRQGMCQAMLPACGDKPSGAAFCDGVTRKKCSSDGLTTSLYPCPERMRCDASSETLCVCDEGYRLDRLTANCVARRCTAGACAGGRCIEGDADYGCECDEGYSGTGAKACTDINECQADHVCSQALYPCVNRTPGYFCRGQFAEWPIVEEARRIYELTVDTALDTVTGLMWQRPQPAEGVYPGCIGSVRITTPGCHFDEAVRYCENLVLGGHSDWRLPTLIELLSIVDYRRSRPAVNAEIFPDTLPNAYWASGKPSTIATSSGVFVGSYVEQTAVYFWDGSVNSTSEQPDLSGVMVRCVR